MIVIAGFPMDLAVSESLSLPGEVTQFPVEVGADFSDHIRNLPEEISLECIASDTPIGEIASDATRLDNGAPTPLPSNDAYHKLLEIRDARRPVTIETSFGTFDNMGLESIEMSSDAAKTGGLFFTVKFKRMNLVTNRRTRARVRGAMPSGPAKAKAKAVEAFATINGRLLWRIGQPNPGDPLRYRDNGDGTRTPLWQWAIVEAVKRNVSEGVRSIAEATGLPVDRAVYRFTGEASAHVKATIRPGEELTPAAREAFFADRARDVDEERANNLRDLRADPLSNANNRVVTKGLPAGKSAARFTRAAPSPPTTQTLPVSR